MNIQLDMDEEKALKKLTWRERVGIRLLLTVFVMVYPIKYNHQLKELFGDVFKGE